MWFIFFMIAFIGVIALLFHINIELNSLDKNIQSFVERLKRHYEQ
jgi:hypothetical protein